MKIIISHDVDHLYVTDHLLRDLIIPKMWVRSLIHLLQRKISLSTFFARLCVIFHNRMHRVEEVIAFDRAHQIPSVFFFGMDHVLGMSYSQKKAAPVIRRVMQEGVDVGVHGVDFQNAEKIQKEHQDFAKISGLDSFGIRTHYVRFDENTFSKMEQAGYLFDTSWFNKQKLEMRAPCKVGQMWEFPLHIMDEYICRPGRLKEGLVATFSAIRQAEEMGLPYCTILFHDCHFDDHFYPELKTWYEQTILWIEKQGYEFTSYREAIEELEAHR